MKMQIVAVRDIKANVYAQPMFVGSLGAAIRSFGDECQREDNNNVLYKHPEDFELWHLGEYDDADGSFYTVESSDSYFDKKQLAVGSNYKR